MSFKLKNLLFEFASEDYKSFAASGAAKKELIAVAEEDLIAVPEEDYENIKKEIELGQVDDVVIEDFVVRNLIEKNEEKINKFISMNQDKLKIAAESKKINLMKILFESIKPQNRVIKGAAAQEDFRIELQKILNKKANGYYEVNSNETGSNTTDITILRNGEKVSAVEVKSAASFENPIAFFDKTIYEDNTDKGNIFVNLIKYLFEKNKVKILSKSNLDSDGKLDEVSLDEIQSANILLSQANIEIKGDYKQCVMFSQMPNELKNNMGKLIHPLEDNMGKLIHPLEDNILCSHKVYHRVLENYETVFYFLKPRPEEGELKFIYLKRTVGDDEIFSRLTPKEITIINEDGKNIEVLRTKSLKTIAKIGHGKFPRAVGTSGKMKKSCFSINLKKDLTLKSVGPEVEDEIRAEAFKLLANHLTDNYFAVKVGNEVRVITSPNENSSDNLELGTEKLTANNITSVQLSPYGATESGKIRVKLECGLNYENFITLPKV